MTTIADRFAHLEQRLASERGPFVLFALLLRPELSTVVSTSDPGVLGRWDLLVAAEWLKSNQKSELEYLTGELKSHMGRSTLRQLSRVVILAPDDPFVKAVTSAFTTEHNPLEVRNTNLFGIGVDRAFIITARPEPTEKVAATK